MRLKSIALIVIAAIAVIATIAVVILLLKSPPTLSIELNPSSYIEVKQGGEFSLSISVRNKAGLFIAEAQNVRGELELPVGFIEKSLQTGTRQLIFGRIDAGDASHYDLTIIASNTVELGLHNAELTISGANIPTEIINIGITVFST